MSDDVKRYYEPDTGCMTCHGIEPVTHNTPEYLRKDPLVHASDFERVVAERDDLAEQLRLSRSGNKATAKGIDKLRSKVRDLRCDKERQAQMLEDDRTDLGTLRGLLDDTLQLTMPRDLWLRIRGVLDG